LSDFNLNKYAKEEAIAGILFAYQNANIDCLVTAIYEGCSLGNNVAPSGSFKIQVLENEKLIVREVEYITLRYRMNHNNSPFVKKDRTECMLSFGGAFRLTVVPHINILTISLDSSPDHIVSFPFFEPSEYLGATSEQQTKPKKHHLSIVKS